MKSKIKENLIIIIFFSRKNFLTGFSIPFIQKRNSALPVNLST
jgi:hypothetical protein